MLICLHAYMLTCLRSRVTYVLHLRKFWTCKPDTVNQAIALNYLPVCFPLTPKYQVSFNRNKSAAPYSWRVPKKGPIITRCSMTHKTHNYKEFIFLAKNRLVIMLYSLTFIWNTTKRVYNVGKRWLEINQCVDILIFNYICYLFLWR